MANIAGPIHKGHLGTRDQGRDLQRAPALTPFHRGSSDSPASSVGNPCTRLTKRDSVRPGQLHSESRNVRKRPTTVMLKGILKQLAEGHQLPKKLAQDLPSGMIDSVTRHLKQGDRTGSAALAHSRSASVRRAQDATRRCQVDGKRCEPDVVATTLHAMAATSVHRAEAEGGSPSRPVIDGDAVQDHGACTFGDKDGDQIMMRYESNRKNGCSVAGRGGTETLVGGTDKFASIFGDRRIYDSTAGAPCRRQSVQRCRGRKIQ
jgi:hypothetical protein